VLLQVIILGKIECHLCQGLDDHWLPSDRLFLISLHEPRDLHDVAPEVIRFHPPGLDLLVIRALDTGFIQQQDRIDSHHTRNMSKIGPWAIFWSHCYMSTSRTQQSRPTLGSFFYELVQRGQLSKEKTGAWRPDQDLIEALKKIRDRGQIPVGLAR